MIGNVDHFVNRQILLWQEERRIAERKGIEGKSSQQPMVCLSRQYGARGAEMGRMVAEQLGFRFYSQELIHDVAQEAQVRDQLVESLDERVQDRISEWVSSLIKRGVFAPSDYLRNLSKVVLTLGRHGKGVIVGRGAHFLLDPQATLRVRVTAPLEMRVARISARDALSADERAPRSCASTASASPSTSSTMAPTSRTPPITIWWSTPGRWEWRGRPKRRFGPSGSGSLRDRSRSSRPRRRRHLCSRSRFAAALSSWAGCPRGRRRRRAAAGIRAPPASARRRPATPSCDGR